jgi:hypothetical protein
MYYIGERFGVAMAPPTERQMKIADLRNKGLTQDEIAKQLGIARSTVARDWAFVKAERSELPLGYEEPIIVSPINKPDLSTSIQVELNCLEFEKMRDSKVIYGREEKGHDRREIFEARSNNIVHSIFLNQVPVKRYIELSKMAFKHNVDAVDLMNSTISLFFRVIKSLQITPYRNIKEVPDSTKLLNGYALDFKQLTSFNQMYNEEQQQMLFEKANEVWISKMENHLEETEQLFNDALSWGISEENRVYYRRLDYDSDELFTILSKNFEKICETPQLLNELYGQFAKSEKISPSSPRTKTKFYFDKITKLALLENGISENDIYIAIEHKIANASFLQAFINSGAKTLHSYRDLDSRGFSSIYDSEEFDDLFESFEEMGVLDQYANEQTASQWRFPAWTKYGELFELLKSQNWDRRKLSIAKEIFDITGHKVGFYESHIVETLSDFEWPSFLKNGEQDNLKELVQRVGIENLHSWIYPEYNPLFLQYAIKSNRNLRYELAKPTLLELMRREYVFSNTSHGNYGNDNFEQMTDSFLMRHGLGWAKSKLPPRPYAVLEIIRNSHGKQIPLLNLMREVKDTLGANYGYSSEGQIREEIEEHLSDICAIQPNDIVQIVGRKRGPMGNEMAFEKFKVEENKTLASVERLSQSSIKPTVVAKFLGAHVNELESFFERLKDEEIHAVRLARVIRDEDLPQGCHLVWRYFVHLVNERRPKLQNEEDTFVHDIDFAKELLGLNSSQVNTLHQVRLIRNDIDHPSEEKVPKPTWKRICGVLKICELF